MNNLNIDGYSFGKFVASEEAQVIVDRVLQKKANDVLVLKYSSINAEIVEVSPTELVSLPKSIEGRESQVLFAGDFPGIQYEKDQFGNLLVSLPKNTAVAVVFYSEKNPLGRMKVFTTVH